MERYTDAIERIKQIPNEKSAILPFRRYFEDEANFILMVEELRAALGADGAEGGDISLLKSYNEKLYRDMSENYGMSWLNPHYSASELGEHSAYAACLSALSLEIRGAVPLMFDERYEELTALLETFIQVYCLFEDGYLEVDRATGEKLLPPLKTVKDVLYFYCHDYAGLFVEAEMTDKYIATDTLLKRVIKDADLANADYLYRMGQFVSPEAIETAEFLASLSDELIDRMAYTWYRGFKDGFLMAGKPYEKKSVIEFIYEPGFERVVRRTAEYFSKDGYDFTVPRRTVHFLNRSPQGAAGFYTVTCKALEQDHAYDMSLVMGERIVQRLLEERRRTFESFGDEIGRYAGPVVMDVFGKAEKLPDKCEEALEFSEFQSKCFGEYRNKQLIMIHEYVLESERSFTIISWPLPSIGEKFEEVFREVVEVNTMDPDVYRPVQQLLCDALDKAEYVLVKGSINDTDMKVYMNKLSDPTKESLFENCLSDVNIPLGEVFTSPRLEGTCGTLHVKTVFIEGVKFTDLRLTFKDGCVTSYGCGNFESEEDSKALVRRVIFGEKENLPLGEFAIGTNTKAYSMIEKYDLGDIMPILIAEKTGPHFAVGDTCYSFAEDMKFFNPDGKELVAKDNSVSKLRTTEPDKAYFAVHTDITIPYSELGSIVAVAHDGSETEIIKSGRFVLPGTEVLNAAFKH